MTRGKQLQAQLAACCVFLAAPAGDALLPSEPHHRAGLGGRRVVARALAGTRLWRPDPAGELGCGLGGWGLHLCSCGAHWA